MCASICQFEKASTLFCRNSLSPGEAALDLTACIYNLGFESGAVCKVQQETMGKKTLFDGEEEEQPTALKINSEFAKRFEVRRDCKGLPVFESLHMFSYENSTMLPLSHNAAQQEA